MVKNLPAMQDTWVQFLGREDPLEEEMATHSSILAWKTPGQRSLSGYSPWDLKESDMIEQPSMHFSINCWVSSGFPFSPLRCKELVLATAAVVFLPISLAFASGRNAISVD